MRVVSSGESATASPPSGLSGQEENARPRVSPTERPHIGRCFVGQDVGHENVDLLMLGRLPEDVLVTRLSDLPRIQRVSLRHLVTVMRRQLLGGVLKEPRQ